VSILRVQLVTAIFLIGTSLPALAVDDATVWDRYAHLLEKYTRDVDAKVGTTVDYRGLAKEAGWKTLVAELAATDPTRLQTRDERLAYWINVYNVFAIDLVLQSYPLESIKDIGSFFRPVWGRDAGTIGGKAYALGEIEDEIIRPMGEARIHAAIVCASVSCPNLRREPFEAARLSAQLDDSLRAWLARPEKGLRLDAERGVLWLSPIFEWFEEDFESQGGVLAFVTAYAPGEARRQLMERQADVALEYFDYDWGLNE